MVQRFRQLACLAALWQFSILAFAFQMSADERVQIVPRVKSSAAAAETAPQTVVRVSSSLVLIPVHVTTVSGSPVTTLKKENFALFEDGVPQTITQFAQDDAPVSVGVLLDTSSSMKNKMPRVSAAATEFFRFANPDDEFFLIEFNGKAKLTVPFTHEWHDLAREIERAKANGLTALIDAIHLAVAQMKQARNTRKALVILSDGGDNYSRRNLRQLRSSLLESEVQVYAMGIFDFETSGRRTTEERNGPQLLTAVAMETGGREFPVRSQDDLLSTGVEIARDLRNQYILGYSPANSVSDGKYRHVNLKLELPSPGSGLHTYYRRGYFAPVQ
ncbi:MAG TPA: VWA domain-containing protein [Candidatus Acidoferrales bacterium]|jgi:Ca-activated chloride channel family protein|nr:VWA domain-containing protein [Candidatus Acidoferrales bacterium]